MSQSPPELCVTGEIIIGETGKVKRERLLDFT